MHLLPQMNTMLDFMCLWQFELPGIRNKWKLQKEKSLSKMGFQPTHAMVPSLRVQRLIYIQILIVVIETLKVNLKSVKLYIYKQIKRIAVPAFGV